MDPSVHPPIVTRLHYEIDGWLGDPLLESFPCFIATQELADAVDTSGLSGVRWDAVGVSSSDQFRELYAGTPLPAFRWMRVVGDPVHDDFALAPDHRLVVSERAWALLQAAGVQHAVVERYE